MSKVYVIGGNYAIETMFYRRGYTVTENLPDANIVCWTGGADVSPKLYKEEPHPTTRCNPQRDKFEGLCFIKAAEQKKTLVGICRGGQFLNVMNGGSLWQDVDNHAIGGEHPLVYEHKMNETTSLSRKVMVTSTHHQMMIPDIRNGAKVWAWAGLSTKKACGMKDSTGKYRAFEMVPNHQTDCEIVFYPKTKSLCFQPHPEYNSKSTQDLFFTCLDRVDAA